MAADPRVKSWILGAVRGAAARWKGGCVTALTRAVVNTIFICVNIDNVLYSMRYTPGSNIVYVIWTGLNCSVKIISTYCSRMIVVLFIVGGRRIKVTKLSRFMLN